MKLTTLLCNACLDSGLRDHFDGGGAVLEFRTGSAPANAGDAVTGTVLASVALPSDVFATAATRAIAKAGTWEDTSADADGTIGYAIMRKTSEGTAGSGDTSTSRILFTVGVGSGEIQFQNLVIGTGQALTITAFSITQPQT